MFFLHYEKLLACLFFSFLFFSGWFLFLYIFFLLFSYQSKKHGGFPLISFVVNVLSFFFPLKLEGGEVPRLLYRFFPLFIGYAWGYI